MFVVVVFHVAPISPNAKFSRNLCGVCLVVKWNDSDTTRQTPRKLSVCNFLLEYFLNKLHSERVYQHSLDVSHAQNGTKAQALSQVCATCEQHNCGTIYLNTRIY